ncbi:MAG: glucosamine-6-phosphate deaminase [Rhodospirillales bacterium]|nr:glucosamine-6-phosphate deaminase [Rhodospirillales bacterium]
MDIQKFDDRTEIGAAAAKLGATQIRYAIEKKGAATIILATGASQFEMIAALIEEPGVDWSRVECFHLDEYIGLPLSHGASFRRYLKERFVEKLPALKAFHFINGEAADPDAEAARLDRLIENSVVDVAFIGIGENGHLAFNDPPADFETEKPFLIVTLDEACRRQQFGEGWFSTLEDVPAQAISMSIKQILAARTLVVAVPGAVKAEAVRNTLEGALTNMVPASILRSHGDCTLFLDRNSSSLLKS